MSDDEDETWDILESQFFALADTETEPPPEKKQRQSLPIIPCYGRDKLLRLIEETEKRIECNAWRKLNDGVVQSELVWFTPEHENKLLRDVSGGVTIVSGATVAAPECMNKARCVAHEFTSIPNHQLVARSTRLWAALTPDELHVFLRTGEHPKDAEGRAVVRPCVLCCRHAVSVAACAAMLGKKCAIPQWYSNTVGIEGGYDKCVCLPTMNVTYAEKVYAPIAALHCDALEWRRDKQNVLHANASGEGDPEDLQFACLKYSLLPAFLNAATFSRDKSPPKDEALMSLLLSDGAADRASLASKAHALHLAQKPEIRKLVQEWWHRRRERTASAISRKNGTLGAWLGLIVEFARVTPGLRTIWSVSYENLDRLWFAFFQQINVSKQGKRKSACTSAPVGTAEARAFFEAFTVTLRPRPRTSSFDVTACRGAHEIIQACLWSRILPHDAHLAAYVTRLNPAAPAAEVRRGVLFIKRFLNGIAYRPLGGVPHPTPVSKTLHVCLRCTRVVNQELDQNIVRTKKRKNKLLFRFNFGSNSTLVCQRCVEMGRSTQVVSAPVFSRRGDDALQNLCVEVRANGTFFVAKCCGKLRRFDSIITNVTGDIKCAECE